MGSRPVLTRGQLRVDGPVEEVSVEAQRQDTGGMGSRPVLTRGQLRVDGPVEEVSVEVQRQGTGGMGSCPVLTRGQWGSMGRLRRCRSRHRGRVQEGWGPVLCSPEGSGGRWAG